MLVHHNDFILEHRNAVSKRHCDRLIKLFEKRKDLQTPGLSGFFNIDPEVKDSTDIQMNASHSRNREIRNCMFPVLKALDHLVFQEYIPRYQLSFDQVDPFKMDPRFNIQRYQPGKGFHGWHSESSSIKNGNRKLVWMIYLNDVENGGTEFLNQNLTTEATTGTLLVWPTDWTHTHRGQRGTTSLKYIITGWYIFQTK